MKRWMALLAVSASLACLQAATPAAARQTTLFFTGFVHGNYGPCG